jgi:hypothetical protein
LYGYLKDVFLLKGYFMKNLNKVLFGLGFFSLALGSLGVSAQLTTVDDQNRKGARVDFEQEPSINPVFVNKPQVILFKIHNIKPVLNSDGNIAACEYTATFFNRTPVNIRQAKIQLGWTDKVSELYPIESGDSDGPKVVGEQKDEFEEERIPEAQRQSAVGEDLGTFRSVLNVPALGSLKQVSVQGQVDTDKCFALFDNIKFNVSVCNILGQDNMVETRRGRVDADKDQLNCSALFAYVNSKHPEYYSEFKKISYEEQVAHERTVEEQEKEMIQSIGEVITKNFNETDSILDEIK